MRKYGWNTNELMAHVQPEQDKWQMFRKTSLRTKTKWCWTIMTILPHANLHIFFVSLSLAGAKSFINIWRNCYNLILRYNMPLTAYASTFIITDQHRNAVTPAFNLTFFPHIYYSFSCFSFLFSRHLNNQNSTKNGRKAKALCHKHAHRKYCNKKSVKLIQQ